MAITMLEGMTSVAATPSREPVQTQPSATTAADIPSATVAARLSGTRVEALSERTETSTTWVNKDGSLTSELASGPVRFRDETGEWRTVNVTLQESGGDVEAVAHPGGLRLAGKGGAVPRSLDQARKAVARDLVTLGDGDEQVTLQWKGGLPSPELDGTRATYSEALPGADVVVESTRTGFEQFVEIKKKPAESYSYTLPVQATGLTAKEQQDGSVLFTDAENRKRAVMPAPVMWDSTVDKVSGERTRRVPVAMKVVERDGAVDLVVTPDADFLADPETKFPVTVDPSTSSLSNVFDTYVQQGETRDWSTDVELDLGNPGTTNANGTPRTARSFISWNTAPIADALVSSAKLSLWNFHSANTDCKAQPWEVWATGAASTSSRWTAQPAWTAKKATSTETRGNPDCTSAPDGWINADVTTMVQEWASTKAARSHMGLRATSETAVPQWKRVNSANASSNVPKLTVTYNYRPRTGTKQEAGPPYFSYGGAYVVNTVRPTLRDTFVDPNGDKIQGAYQIFDSATDAQVGEVLRSGFVPSGQPAPVVVPAGVLTSGKTYKFRSSPYDGTHYNLGWSAWKTFTVDTQAPSAPTKIVSTDYPTGQWVKGAGKPGVFTVTPASTDLNWLEWSLDGTTWTKVTTGASASPKTMSVTPPRNGSHTLLVRAVDRADNRSEASEYSFHAGPGGFLQPSDGERTARRLPLVAEAEVGKFTGASFSWRRSEADPWVRIPTSDVTSGGNPVAAWPVPMTNGRNAPLVWKATDTVDPDGTVQIKADFTGPNSATGSTTPLSVVVDRNASGASSQGVGPGQVNMLTGDYSLSASDASAFDLSVTRTATSRTPDKGAAQEGQAPIFGREWVTGTAAELTDSDWSHVRRITDTAVALIDSEGEETYFSANAAKTAWIPEPGAEDLVLKGAVTGSFTLTDSDGTLTTFTKPDATASTWQVSSTLLDGLTNSATTVLSETTTVGGKKLARPKRIIAPTSAAAATACGADPATKGCRVIEFVYATSTTATGGTLGDFSGQTKEIRLWSTAPGAASATSKSVQTYLYDAGGRLRQAWDPQITPSLKTEYAYDSTGRVTQLTPPGELPWTFTYGKAGDAATAGEGMLTKAARSGLKQGTADTTEGTAATSVVYDVPLTGATAPFKMAAGDVKAWGQLDAPTDAAAVFPSDAVPASHSGSSLAATAYKRANLHYLGVSGRQVNSISPGGYVTTTEYDHFGNTVRQLSAANRAIALGLSAEDKAVQADLGIAQLSSAERADLLATRSVHSEDGTRELEEFGPLRRVELTADLKSGSTLLVPSGTSVTSRPWTVNQYDAGRPSDGTANVKDQVTKVTIGGEVREHPGVMGETRATQTVFDWAKGLPTQTIQDPGGLALTTKTEYDAQGRVTKQLLPGANGTDAATRVTTYWSASGTGACNGRPEWDGLVCALAAAGGATTGGSGSTALPVTTTEYDWWGNPAKVTETAGSQTRTTTMSYDPAGRSLKTAVTGGLGQAVPETTTEYEPTNGRPGKIVSSTGGTLTKGYDRLGRLIAYADADAGRTTTEYDLLDRPVKVTDTAPSTTVYTYDHTAEPGGMATSMTDSVAGTFGYAYDADGNIKEERLPGGYRLAIGTDTNGTAVSRTYTRSDGTMVYSDTVNSSVHGQTVGHTGWSEQNYRYDAAGRIAAVEDTAETVCTRRAYTFDARSNRKSLTTATGGPGADCPTSGGAATASTYDSADRLTNSGYNYDAFGRTLSLPGAGTVGYYANDLVHQQTANGKRQTWQLDAALRFRSWKVETGSGSTWTQTASKLNHYGDDSDVPRWIVEDTATGALTRNVASATGQLQATTAKSGNIALQLTTIHGDVALQLPLDAAEAPVAMDYDEYGVPRATSAQGRYGWLGGAQRSGETVTGLTLMGVRLYNPETGRFLSVDPVYGGSANAYEYAMGDPVNGFDLDGKKAKKTTKWKHVSTYWVNGKWYNSTYSNMPRPLRAFFQGIMGRFMVGVYIDSMKWQGRWRHGKWTRYYKGKKQTKRGKVTTGFYNYADRSRMTVCVPWVGCYTQTSAWNDGRWG
ncbi:DNRLRE domain-containing protein [Streptomyces sp. NPDC056454]|uniref:DNRLRE domain-containing protein n=1 Tax=Streptomyces sp. NPDC056454 TaxID=3345823 RepID=UPI0036A77D2F